MAWHGVGVSDSRNVGRLGVRFPPRHVAVDHPSPVLGSAGEMDEKEGEAAADWAGEREGRYIAFEI